MQDVSLMLSQTEEMEANPKEEAVNCVAWNLKRFNTCWSQEVSEILKVVCTRKDTLVLRRRIEEVKMNDRVRAWFARSKMSVLHKIYVLTPEGFFVSNEGCESWCSESHILQSIYKSVADPESSVQNLDCLKHVVFKDL